jgi:hypothetical protein
MQQMVVLVGRGTLMFLHLEKYFHTIASPVILPHAQFVLYKILVPARSVLAITEILQIVAVRQAIRIPLSKYL